MEIRGMVTGVLLGLAGMMIPSTYGMMTDAQKNQEKSEGVTYDRAVELAQQGAKGRYHIYSPSWDPVTELERFYDSDLFVQYYDERTPQARRGEVASFEQLEAKAEKNGIKMLHFVTHWWKELVESRFPFMPATTTNHFVPKALVEQIEGR